MLRFESPQYLVLLMIVAILFGVFLFNLRRWKWLTVNTFGKRVVPYLVQNYSTQKALWKMIFYSVALTFLILAWARPQSAEGQTEIKSEGVEVMILVDVSRSMLAEDVRPSRLEHAKKEIISLLDALGGDKVGLIAFAGSAVLLSPLTTDKNALKMFIEGLSPDSVENQGTEMARALNEAKEAFKRGGFEVGDGSKVTKVALLISDGEDHEKGAETEVKELLDQGIRVFAMAFGTAAGAKVPVRDAHGQLRGYLQDAQGQPVVSTVHGEFLKTLAELGQGSFYHVTFGGDQMKSLKEDLDLLEKAEFDTVTATNFQENFQIFLIIALVFALLELLLGNRKKISKEWKGRFPV